ncbi:MAG: hypothetical protein ACOCZ6_05105 [Nanoarchaeota archaeon]
MSQTKSFDGVNRDLHIALNNIRPLTPEKKKEHLLEQKKKELGGENFQEWLFEQFGL